MRGYLEALSSTFACGWAEFAAGAPSHVFARLDHEVLGFARADERRGDLEYAAQQGGLLAGGFFLVFSRALAPEEQARLTIQLAGEPEPLVRLPELKVPKLPVFPVFVVGSPRSGTSILTRALQAAGYAGYREGNFLSLIHAFEFQINAHFKIFGSSDPYVLTTHVDTTVLKLGVAGVLRDGVEKLYRGKPWLDKTGNPEMIEAIPILRAIWPDSVFIFAKRRAVENIVSRLLKFPAHSFEYHCADWTRNMNTWRRMRKTQTDLKYIEIDQRDIAEQPEETAALLADFLNMPSELAELMTGIFTRERPQETAHGTALRTLTLGQTGWSAEQLDIFHRRCGVEMHEYGYTEDAGYRQQVALAG